MFTLTLLCSDGASLNKTFNTMHARQVYVEGTVSELELSGLEVEEQWVTDHETDHLTVCLDISDDDSEA